MTPWIAFAAGIVTGIILTLLALYVASRAIGDAGVEDICGDYACKREDEE